MTDAAAAEGRGRAAGQLHQRPAPHPRQPLPRRDQEQPGTLAQYIHLVTCEQDESVLNSIVSDAARALPPGGEFAFQVRGSWKQAGRSAEAIDALLAKHGMASGKTSKAVVDLSDRSTA